MDLQRPHHRTALLGAEVVHDITSIVLSEKGLAFDVPAMTDTHLLKTYERLFSPRMGSVFDRL